MVTLRNFFLSVSFIVSVQVRIFPLNMRDIIIYVARWWEKYLSKRSLIKHTCSWRDKLIALRTLKRQAKIFLRISKMEMLDVWLISENTIDTSCLDLTRSSKIIIFSLLPTLLQVLFIRSFILAYGTCWFLCFQIHQFFDVIKLRTSVFTMWKTETVGIYIPFDDKF